jgi:hypothetical protein
MSLRNRRAYYTTAGRDARSLNKNVESWRSAVIFDLGSDFDEDTARLYSQIPDYHWSNRDPWPLIGDVSLPVDRIRISGSGLGSSSGDGRVSGFITNFPQLYLTIDLRPAMLWAWKRGTFAASAGRRRRNCAGGRWS